VGLVNRSIPWRMRAGQTGAENADRLLGHHGYDGYGMVEFGVSGYVQDVTQAAVNSKRSTLIADIERLIMSSTGVADVCGDIWPLTVETDEGVLEGLGTCEITFRARYFYNHKGP